MMTYKDLMMMYGKMLKT